MFTPEELTSERITSAAGRKLKPKQLDFVKNYLLLSSDTYGNAMQSAIKAGYKKSYAKDHAHRALRPLADKLMEKKEAEAVKEVNKYDEMLALAEKGLKADMEIPDDAPPSMRAIRNKTVTFVAESIGKDKYSKRVEHENTHKMVLDENKQKAVRATLADVMNGKTIENPTYQVLDAPDNDEKDAPSEQ